MEESIIELLKEFIHKYEIDKIFKELNLPTDEDTMIFIIGVLTGLLQIVKRNKKYYVRVTPITNLPYKLFKDIYPDTSRKVLEVKSLLFKIYRGDVKKVAEAMKKLKESGFFSQKTDTILTEEQKKKILDRLLRLL